MVRLHSLQSGDKHTAAGQVISVFLGGDGTLDGTSGPEAVVHRAPRVLGVSAKVGSTILANGEARGFASELEVNDAVRVDGRLDGVGVTLLVEGDGHVIGAAREHLFVEHEIVQRIGVPDVRGIAFEFEDLRVEVRSSMDTSESGVRR